MKNLKLRSLCEGAIFVALAQILGYIKFYELAQGGSITLSMLPIFIYSIRWGLGPGLLAAFAFSLLQVFGDTLFAVSWISLIGDYVLAYTVLGLCGLFRGMPHGIYWGTIVGSFDRFVVNYVVGATVWGEWMPEEFLGMTMTSPWIYSALYNVVYVGPSMVLCLIVVALLYKPLGTYFRGEDLAKSAR